MSCIHNHNLSDFKPLLNIHKLNMTKCWEFAASGRSGLMIYFVTAWGIGECKALVSEAPSTAWRMLLLFLFCSEFMSCVFVSVLVLSPPLSTYWLFTLMCSPVLCVKPLIKYLCMPSCSSPLSWNLLSDLISDPRSDFWQWFSNCVLQSWLRNN